MVETLLFRSIMVKLKWKRLKCMNLLVQTANTIIQRECQSLIASVAKRKTQSFLLIIFLIHAEKFAIKRRMNFASIWAANTNVIQDLVHLVVNQSREYVSVENKLKKWLARCFQTKVLIAVNLNVENLLIASIICVKNHVIKGNVSLAPSRKQWCATVNEKKFKSIVGILGELATQSVKSCWIAKSTNVIKFATQENVNHVNSTPLFKQHVLVEKEN